MTGSIVVVGGGVAGARVARNLRRGGYRGALLLLDSEAYPPYDRPPLSKGVVQGIRDLPELFEPNELSRLDIDWRPTATAVHLEPASHELVLGDGSRLRYRILILATGAKARRLTDVAGRTLRTYSDALHIRDTAISGSTCLVVGAGLIGCELTASLRQRGVEVHLVDAATGPMQRVLGRDMAARASDLHRKNCVKLHLGTTVTSMNSGTAELSDGSKIHAHMIVEAVGTEPDLDWLAESGLALGNGIWTDAKQRTSDPDIYAIGDIAAPHGRRTEHWTEATRQADRAAASILGHSQPPEEPAYWWSDQYDAKFQGLGDVGDADQIVIGVAGRGTLALYGRGGRLRAAVGINAPSALMRTRGAIIDRAPLLEVTSLMSEPLWLTPDGRDPATPTSAVAEVGAPET